MLNEAEVQKMNAAKKLNKQKGASMIEYAIVVAAVAGVAAIFLGDTGTLTTSITSVFNSAITEMAKL
jgi:pilus assembly protein Flp/PilA